MPGSKWIADVKKSRQWRLATVVAHEAAGVAATMEDPTKTTLNVDLPPSKKCDPPLSHSYGATLFGARTESLIGNLVG